MTRTDRTAIGNWRDWNYAEWNSRLADYCFAIRPGEPSSAVEQLPATPQELVLVTGDPDATEAEVVKRFVTVMKWKLPGGETTFRTFCVRRTAWTPSSSQPPHFFAMLWLTCLVAHGYPYELKRGFYVRMEAIFGRTQDMDCLPGLWQTLQDWTVANAATGHCRRLVLPPPDSFRKRIGASWFLAFPHDHDRAKLRNLLEKNGLVGDEPPLRRVVKLLRDARGEFSADFGKDLNEFVDRFLTTDLDVRNSAFWRAVRQEALRIGETNRGRTADLQTRLMAFFDEDEELLKPYVASTRGAALPTTFEKVALGFEHDGFACLVRQADDRAADPVEGAVAAALKGTLEVPRAARHYTRGVMIFRSVAGGDFELVGGTDAENADMALVRNDLAGAFTANFGGRREPACLTGWSQVSDCRVRIGQDPPAGLEGVSHLQATMASPSVRIVGGIRGDDGYVALEGFLPRIRFHGATDVEILDADGLPTCRAFRSENSPDEWMLPDVPLAKAPGRYIARVRWPSADGPDNTATCEFMLGNRQLTHDYKPLGAGVYALESVDSGVAEVSRGEDVPDWISRAPSETGADRIPDLIVGVTDVFYLGPCLGDVSTQRAPCHEWLVVGDTDQPSQLVFVGDAEAPSPRGSRKSVHNRDRSVWRRAVHHSSSVGVRVKDGDIETLDMHPRVREVLASFRDRARDGADIQDESVGGSGTVGASVWTGVEPVARTWELVDAFAALSVRRSGIRLNTAVELFGQATGFSRFDHADTLYELLRSWVEAGLLDVAHARGQPVTYVLARRPGFVAYRVGRRFRASLVGLVPSFDEARFERLAARSGALVTRRRGANTWQPPVFQVDVADLAVIRSLSSEFDLAPTRWFDADLVVRPQDDTTGEGPQAESSYVRERVWDWRASRFRAAGADETPFDVTVELRRHPRSCPVYVIRQGGEDVFRSELRNATLTKAFLLKYGDLPFTDEPGEPVRRTWARGVYLPVRFGRLCALLGDGLAGPSVDRDGRVDGYSYPLSGRYRSDLAAYLNPLAHPIS